jgi:hypothetical protein
MVVRAALASNGQAMALAAEVVLAAETALPGMVAMADCMGAVVALAGLVHPHQGPEEMGLAELS